MTWAHRLLELRGNFKTVEFSVKVRELKVRKPGPREGQPRAEGDTASQWQVQTWSSIFHTLILDLGGEGQGRSLPNLLNRPQTDACVSSMADPLGWWGAPELLNVNDSHPEGRVIPSQKDDQNL